MRPTPQLAGARKATRQTQREVLFRWLDFLPGTESARVMPLDSTSYKTTRLALLRERWAKLLHGACSGNCKARRMPGKNFLYEPIRVARQIAQAADH